MNAALKLGSDPELVPVSMAEGKFTPKEWSNYRKVLTTLGTKTRPLPLDDRCSIQRDSGAVELGMTPATTPEEFLDTLSHARGRAESWCGMPLVGVREVLLEPYASEIEAAGMTRWFKEIGCSRDYTIFDIPDDKPVLRARTVPSRVRSTFSQECGFHLHFDVPELIDRVGTDGEEQYSIQTIETIDHALYPIYKRDCLRDRTPGWYRVRKVMRLTPYGVEYRSLGADVMESPCLEEIVYTAFEVMQTL